MRNLCLCIFVMSLTSLTLLNAVLAAKDPFAGRKASCDGGNGVKEKWKFFGMSGEYEREIPMPSMVLQAKGKYSVKGNVLTIQEYKKDTKEIDPDRKFNLKFQLNDDGYEYIWNAVKDKEINYACSWVKG